LSRSLSAFAQAPSQAARIVVDSRRVIATLDRRVFGSFLEHLGRAIYGGIFEPGSPLADQNGFRRDVISEISALGVPIVRYPGGNFVSGYDWLDGVGPRASRPAVLDRAWNSIETNQFGTNEFLAWCRMAGAEPLLGLNFGTGTAEKAAALVEYCNVPSGTRWSAQRAPARHRAAVAARFCLGNEMDGPWQIGHMTAEEHGRKAVDAARQMRAVDPRLQLVACGSSGPGMSTTRMGSKRSSRNATTRWTRSRCTGIGLSSDAVKDDARFLASNLEMERQIEDVAAVCDYVRGRKRSAKRLWLSFDEWNVWYRQTGGNGRRQQAPHLLEEVYDLRDALVVGGALNSLMRHADRVRLAFCSALNVIAPLVTDATAVVRTIYYPHAWALAYAKGQVSTFRRTSPRMTRPPSEKAALSTRPHPDPATGDIALFLLNRDPSAPASCA
jgi:alpha-N-arabinofuranosidase